MTILADVLVHGLKRAGVERVFGLPGGESVEIMDAIRRSGLEFILVHNESSAVFMADATARLSGNPCACLTTLGPGATNSIAGVAHAFLDRAPVVIITAQVADAIASHHTHQLVDLPAIFRPITKGSFKLQAATASQRIQQALDLLYDGRPGPVHLQVSNEEAAQPSSGAPIAQPRRRAVLQSAQDMQSVRGVVSQSRRPVIVTGLGLEPEAPYEALRKLAEVARAPVIVTPKAKGSLPEDHPLFAGTVGLTRRDAVYEILDEADCILAVSMDAVELVKPWDQTAPLIWIAPWQNQDPLLPSRAEFVGPVAPILRLLANLSWTTHESWGTRRVERFHEKESELALATARPGLISPQSILRLVRQTVPRDAIFTTDVGSHKILSCLTWPCYTPNSFLVSNGLSCMGFSLPAAIAASLAQPGRTVVCSTGDAGISMVLGELAVLARLGTPVMVLVFKDGALDLIRSHQIRSGKQPFGTEFSPPSFARIAEAYGIRAWTVSSAPELGVALEIAVAQQKPALIETLIDPLTYPTRPTLSSH